MKLLVILFLIKLVAHINIFYHKNIMNHVLFRAIPEKINFKLVIETPEDPIIQNC